MDIYLDPVVHGRGVGADAVRTLARHLFVDHGHHWVVIDPAVGNAAAIACYTRVGFRPVGVAQAERLLAAVRPHVPEAASADAAAARRSFGEVG